MKQKAVIFDLDGVIVNTVPLHFKAWKRMFSEYGKKFTFADYKKKVDGVPRLTGARAVLKELPGKELQKAARRKQSYFLRLFKKGKITVYRDAFGLIRRLKKAGFKVAVISSSKNCLYILNKTGIINLFEVIITGNDTKRGKPYPDVFLMAARRLGLQPKDCVVIEDAVLGIEASRRARMKSIGIDRYHKPQRLNKADIVVDSLRKISLLKIKAMF